MKRCVTILILMLIPAVSNASFSKEFKRSFENTFRPAVYHKGLETAAYPLDISKINTFVVIEQDKIIPANRAFYFLFPSDYDYIGAVIDTEKNELIRRRKDIYTYLPKGTIMGVTSVEYSGRTVYLKLISLQEIGSTNNPGEQATKVTVMLGFKFNKETIKGVDAEPAIQMIKKWLVPFANYSEAANYANKILTTQNRPR